MVFCDVLPCSLADRQILTNVSEEPDPSVFLFILQSKYRHQFLPLCQVALYHIPEGCNFNIQYCEKLNSQRLYR